MRRRRSVGDTVLRGFGKHRCLTGQEEVDLETEELTDRIAIGGDERGARRPRQRTRSADELLGY